MPHRLRRLWTTPRYYPMLFLRPNDFSRFWDWAEKDLWYAITLEEGYKAWVREGKPSPLGWEVLE